MANVDMLDPNYYYDKDGKVIAKKSEQQKKREEAFSSIKDYHSATKHIIEE